jgi:hypothetical protein
MLGPPLGSSASQQQASKASRGVTSPELDLNQTKTKRQLAPAVRRPSRRRPVVCLCFPGLFGNAVALPLGLWALGSGLLARVPAPLQFVHPACMLWRLVAGSLPSERDVLCCLLSVNHWLALQKFMRSNGIVDGDKDPVPWSSAIRSGEDWIRIFLNIFRMIWSLRLSG